MAENTTTRTQRSASATKATTRRKTTATKRSTAAKRGAQTRAAKSTKRTTKRTSTAAKRRATAAQRQVQVETKTGVDRVAEVAEKAALTYVGGLLTVRDNVVSTVEGLVTKYDSPEKAQRKLEVQQRKLERRGQTARRSLERQVKRTRTQLERQARQRRNRLQRQVRPLVKNARAQAGTIPTQGEYVGARIEKVAQSVATTGTQVAEQVSKRVGALS